MSADVHHSLVIPPSEVDASRLLSWWSYLVPKPGRVLGLSPFGDWFLEQANGAIWRLDVLDGSFDEIAPSAEAFLTALDTDAAQDDWLQAGTVRALEREGQLRRPSQCYTYVVHPRLGAPVDTSNIQLGDLGAWQLFCSQLHPQLDAVPERAQITRLDCDADGRLTVEWRMDS